MFARSLGFNSPSVYTTVIPITSNTNNIDVNAESVQQGWNGAKRLRSFCTVNSGVEVTSTTNTAPALNVNLRESDFVQIVNNGTIAGAPGNGGSGGLDSSGQPGQPGGDAIVVTNPTTIINNGIIGPGEGGAGGDGGINTPFSNFARWAFAGCPQGSFHGGGGTCGVCAYTVRVRAGKGFRNETRFVNANCTPVYNTGVTRTRGNSGSRGQRGAGRRGGSGRTNTFAGGAGGPPGAPIRGENFIRLLNTGTIVQPQ